LNLLDLIVICSMLGSLKNQELLRKVDWEDPNLKIVFNNIQIESASEYEVCQDQIGESPEEEEDINCIVTDMVETTLDENINDILENYSITSLIELRKGINMPVIFIHDTITEWIPKLSEIANGIKKEKSKFEEDVNDVDTFNLTIWLVNNHIKELRAVRDIEYNVFKKFANEVLTEVKYDRNMEGTNEDKCNYLYEIRDRYNLVLEKISFLAALKECSLSNDFNGLKAKYAGIISFFTREISRIEKLIKH
jgi:hypothetical protein